MVDRPFAKAKVAVLGLAYSHITRATRPEAPSLGDECVDTCRRAIADADLSPDHIDGVTSHVMHHDGGRNDGVRTVSPQYIWRRLRLPVRWGEVNNKYLGSSLIEAHNAIAGGACRYALVWWATDFARGNSTARKDRTSAAGEAQFVMPYGGAASYIFHAVTAQRYYQKYGATREHMANFIVANRRHALMNEKGYWSLHKPEELTVADYLSARMLADPFCVYDADIPVRGCIAYVLGPAQAAQDLSHGAAYIKAFAQAWIGPNGPGSFYHEGGRLAKPSLEDNEELPALFRRNLWEPAGLRPSDITTANLYDGFSILAWLHLEALGFCGVGEAFEFVQDGRTGLTGQLPVNTGGGHLGEGHLGGGPHYSEAILQAMGRSGARQVAGVRYALASTDRPTRAQVMIFGSEPT